MSVQLIEINLNIFHLFPSHSSHTLVPQHLNNISKIHFKLTQTYHTNTTSKGKFQMRKKFFFHKTILLFSKSYRLRYLSIPNFFWWLWNEKCFTTNFNVLNLLFVWETRNQKFSLSTIYLLLCIFRKQTSPFNLYLNLYSCSAW